MKRIYLVPTVLMGCVSLTFAQKKESDTIKSDNKMTDIEEVVMIGYGSQKKSDVTGAVGSVKAEDFNKGMVANVGQLLQGKVAGVNVSNVSGEPGANQNIIIRGVGSLRSGTTPLYVIDGFVIDNTNTGVANNPMNFINPDDIASVDVLKDASAAAIYGARGANGVIVITTKKGKKGRTQLNLSSNLTISNLANKMNVFSADEFRTQVTAMGGKLDDMGGNTDWQDELTRTAISNNVNFSAAGATDNSNYYAALGYENQEGILYNSNLRRYSGRVNISQKAFDGRVNIDFNLNGSRTENNRPNATSTVSNMLTWNPTYPAYTDGSPTTVFNNGAFNPLIRQQIYKDFTNNNRILANISPSVEIIKGLTYKLNFGVDYSTADRIIQNIPHAVPLEIGSLDLNYFSNNNTLVENTLTYKFKINRHDFNVLAGHSYQKFMMIERGWDYSVFPNNGIEPQYQIGAANKNNTTSTSSATKNELQSWFGRANYGYQDKYLLTATLRADGSSKFGRNNRYGIFPSFAAGWNISKENFLADVSLVSNLKLRASWGKTGNQEMPNKITKRSYKSASDGGGQATYPMDGSGNYPVGFYLVRADNPGIQWEVTTQTNIGVDFGFMNNRLTGTFDFFNKVSDNILLDINPVDPISAEEKMWKNIPNMTINNTGYEISLNYNSNTNKAFTYSIGGNASFIKNEVKDSPYRVLSTGEAQGPGTTNAVINGYINNQPIGTFYVREFLGLNENGTNIFRDVDGDGIITDNDRVAAGSALPDFTYNLYLKAAYKNFDLGLNFNGVAGNMIYNNTASTLFTRGRLGLSQNTTDAATQFPNESANNTNVISTRYLEKGDFLRLNNATLGYNLNPKVLGIGEHIRNIRFTVTAQNLFVITKYSGFDPEINTGVSQGGIQSFGIDYATYPKARSFAFGVNVAF
ncbi:SusC/RagA family TonB-linked outer membrane protein [Chryseobacterium indoltheticum]|jgi:iron complex outermembrane receptor protein|uniref:SusC/RagA family TonB-linked outer membrane protein n=1 Tax=Chryseobacterium indoltheticum TaxID=254 RepID=UPI00242BA8F1|nr:SusC/RagA family TonB-linked outer membrane protein [Chryseobacterium indoltheticum]MDF2834359.1 SusC/RagA family TonB-linked outer membrane protein [Chryseobacterium indoltheticum]